MSDNFSGIQLQKITVPASYDPAVYAASELAVAEPQQPAVVDSEKRKPLLLLRYVWCAGPVEGVVECVNETHATILTVEEASQRADGSSICDVCATWCIEQFVPIFPSPNRVRAYQELLDKCDADDELRRIEAILESDEDFQTRKAAEELEMLLDWAEVYGYCAGSDLDRTLSADHNPLLELKIARAKRRSDDLPVCAHCAQTLKNNGFVVLFSPNEELEAKIRQQADERRIAEMRLAKPKEASAAKKAKGDKASKKKGRG